MAAIYSRVWWLLLTVCVTCAVSPAVPKPSHKSRVADRPLSEKKHFDGESHGIHNMEFDHDAFLGSDEAKKFDELSPAESKQKLGLLFIKIDRDADGLLSEDELHNWMKLVQNRNVWSETDERWKELSPSRAEFVSWSEFEKFTHSNPEDEEDAQAIKQDKRRWELADVDHDGYLSREEFHTFLHPELASHMKNLIVEETLEEVDKNHDGVISFDEYLSDAVGDDDEDSDAEWIQEEEHEFRTELDRNKDGILDRDEIYLWIVPDDLDHITEETRHLLSEADHNKDGFLNVEEVVGNYDLFVGSQITDYGDIFKRDEL